MDDIYSGGLFPVHIDSEFAIGVLGGINENNSKFYCCAGILGGRVGIHGVMPG